MYDVIVVGARCGGSPTAMLLAQLGHRVLLVDRASFPSDTVSTHLVTTPEASMIRHAASGGTIPLPGPRSPPDQRLRAKLNQQPAPGWSFPFGAARRWVRTTGCATGRAGLRNDGRQHRSSATGRGPRGSAIRQPTW